MRILIISPAYPPAAAGEAEHCHQIAAHLAAAGHSVTVLTGRVASPTAHEGFQLRTRMTGWRWRNLPELVRQLVVLRPEGVILIYATWLFDGHPMITFLPTLLRRISPRARLLALMEIYQVPPLASAGVRAGRKLAAMLAGHRGVDYSFGTLLRDSHTMAALGPTIIASLSQHDLSVLPRALIIPPPPLLARPRDMTAQRRRQTRVALGAGDDMLVLAYFGYVYPGKGVETLLAALQLLRGCGRKVRLIMSGGGRGEAAPGQAERHAAFEGQMQNLAHHLGVAENVVWTQGYVGGSDAAALDLMASDIAVLPFDNGAELRRSSIAVVVAMGLPLVTTQPSVHEPAFVDERSVLLCPPRDAQALAAAISRVADDSVLRTNLQAGALALAREWFSWEAAVKKLTVALSPQSPS